MNITEPECGIRQILSKHELKIEINNFEKFSEYIVIFMCLCIDVRNNNF